MSSDHSFVGLPACPCGSDKAYADCCQLLHQANPAAAATPEALMRSRYTAYTMGLADYLLATWHSSVRPAELKLGGGPQWVSLQVLTSSEEGNKGRVYFRAIHKSGAAWGFMEEESDFIKENNTWFYVTGRTREGSFKPGRNEPCPCGSGLKYKACCLK